MPAKVNVKTKGPAHEPEAEKVEQDALAPAVDIYEDESGLVIVADLPGVKREDVSAAVEAGVLTLAGQVQRPATDETVLYSEYEPVSFRRTFALGESLDPAGIDATLKNGVLTVRLPKAESAKTRRITVTGE
jgi:HSP20 family protein